jgi:hypothetical protein
VPDLSELSARLSDITDRLADLPEAFSALPERLGSLPERLRDVTVPAAGLGKVRRSRPNKARRFAVPLAVALAVTGAFLLARTFGSRPKRDPLEPGSAERSEQPDSATR